MSNLNIVPELLMGNNELNRWNKFIFDELRSAIKNGHAKYGVVRNWIVDPAFDNFKVIAGSNPGTIALASQSVAVDKDALMLVQEAFDNAAVPSGSTYHVVIEHQYSHVEAGVVGIATDGVMSGVSTEFTKVLRGQPNFPTKVKFYGSATNTGEYIVVEVVSDTSVLLSGTFVAETDLRYSAIGTFTPSAVIPSQDREIYQYDSCLFQIIEDSVYTSMLPLTEGKQFKIAQLVNTAGVVEIKDYRSDILTTTDEYFLDRLDDIEENVLIGVEAMKWDNEYSTKDKSEMSIAWGFRSSNWTIEPSLRRITFTSGNGGKFKTSGDFANGDFDGWRLYNQAGDYKKIIASTKSTTSINLTVESLNPADYSGGEELYIMPDVEEVIIKVSHDESGADKLQIDNEYAFPVMTPVAKIYLLVPSASPYSYNVKFRYKKFNRYTAWALLPDDAVGYYDETSFDSTGELKANPLDRTLFPYTGTSDGYIQVIPNPGAYKIIIDSINTGDIFGVRTIALDNGTPNTTLYVGTDKNYQHFTGSPVVLSADMFVILKSTKVDLSAIVNGNNFLLHFKQKIDLNGFALRVVHNYTNPTTYTLLKEFDEADQEFLETAPEGIFIRATFNGTTWILNGTNEVKINKKIDQAATLTVDATYASFTQIPGLEYTTPNDGRKRRLKISYIAVCNTNINQDVANSGARVRLYNETQSVEYDRNEMMKAISDTFSYTTGTLYVQTIELVDPGDKIRVDAELLIGGESTLSRASLSIEEL